MARVAILLGTLTIPNNQQESNIIQGDALKNLVGLVFYNPAAFTGTVAVEVAWPKDALAAAHGALSNNGTAIELTAAIVERFDVSGFASIMLDADTNQGAERVVQLVGIVDINT